MGGSDKGPSSSNGQKEQDVFYVLSNPVTVTVVAPSASKPEK
jgi:hypothetical protein